MGNEVSFSWVNEHPMAMWGVCFDLRDMAWPQNMEGMVRSAKPKLDKCHPASWDAPPVFFFRDFFDRKHYETLDCANDSGFLYSWFTFTKYQEYVGYWQGTIMLHWLFSWVSKTPICPFPHGCHVGWLSMYGSSWLELLGWCLVVSVIRATNNHGQS